MSDKIDEIVDRLIKGGRGSGKRGHKTPLAPVSDIKREFDPEKKKKILSSDKRAAKKEVKDHSPEELQSKIDNHKELSENKFLSPASRESYAAKHKALISHQKKMKLKETISPEKKPEGIASRPGPFGNINKGGPGSGKKGHMGVTPDRTQRERNKQKAGDALQTSKDAKRIIAELDLGKEDLKELRDYASAEGITPSQFIVNNKEHIKTNLKKGGPGSGKKGHKTSGKIEPKHFEPNPNLRDKNKDLDRLTPEQSAERKRKKEEYQKQNRKERLKERADEAHRQGNHKEYEKLISQVRAIKTYSGNPASDAVSPTSHGTKPEGKGKYGVEGGKYLDPASEGASAAMTDNRRANTEKYLEQLKTSLSLERDPEAQKGFKKDIADIEKELKMNKSIEALYHLKQLAETGRIKPKQKRNMRKGEEIEKVLPLAAAAKTAGRIVQNAIKPTPAGEGSDVVPGSPDGPSVAHGSGGGKAPKGPGKKIKKSFAERLLEMRKGGIGSGRKGHHSIGRDYGDNEHDSVFEDSRYDSTQEREIFMDKMHDAIKREEDRADQRIKEKESTAKRGMSRKPKKEAPKKTLLQKLTQKIIDAI